MITQINIVKEPEYYYPAAILDSGKSGLMTYEESSKLSDLPNASNIVQKSQTAGLLRNNGTVDTNSYVKESDIELEKTTTGNPITLTDAIAGNAISVSADINAVQDLHGYDKPWVGGAGKSKVDFGLTDASGGLTVTTTNNVISISGTCSASPYIKEIGESTISPNTYKLIISGENCPAFRLNYVLKKNGSTVYTSSDDWVYTDQHAYNATLDLSGYDFDTISFSVKISNGSQFTNAKLYPMLCLATETDTSFAPYANICPITGHSSVVITDVDAESHTATVTVALGSTVYGGTLDLTSGELTVDHGEVDLGSLDWEKQTLGTGIYNFRTSTPTDIKKVADTSIPDMKCSQYETVSQNDIVSTTNPIDSAIALRYSHYSPIDGLRVRDTRFDNATAEDFKTAMSGVQLVYELATPTTLTLTPTQLALVKGYNQLSCNSGDMSITYKASGLDALKERVDELEDAVEDLTADVASKAENSVVGNVENGTTASQAYAVGEHFIRNDKFCTAIATIASGATLTQGTNYVEGTIAECIARQGTYSTDEVEIGTWNGARLYRKGFDVGSLTGGQTTEYSTGLSNITVRDYWAMVTRTSDGNVWKAPYVWSTSGQNIGMGVDAVNNITRILLRAGSDYSGITAFAFLEYTKNS